MIAAVGITTPMNIIMNMELSVDVAAVTHIIIPAMKES